ncbi:MAG: TRAP transporter substrate-binding protein DctP [Sandaracinaceae bacterium]
MTRRALVLGARLALLAVVLALPPDVGAQETEPAHVLRIATLMPRGGRTTQLLNAWNQTLSERTGGRLQVRVYWGGSMGDERTVVRRMRIGQIDGASLTSAGMSLIHRPVLVMQAPGIFQSYRQVDAVRREIGPELAQAMDTAGFGLLGWGDAGRVRLFSQEPLHRPSDLRSRRPWVPSHDSIFREMLGVVGATGIPLSVGEVFGGLHTRMIDVVPSTAIATAGLQWFTSLRYVTQQSDGFLVGGMVVRNGFLEQLRPEDRDALFEVSAETHETLMRGVRQMDERAFTALTNHGIRSVDIDAHRAEWVRVAHDTRQRMAARVVPADLLARVERIAEANREP